MKNRTEMIYRISSQFFFFSPSACLCHVDRAAFTESVCRSWPRATRSGRRGSASSDFFLFFFCFNCSTCLCISSCLWMGVDLTLSCLAQAGSIVCHAGPHDAVRHVHTAVSPRSTAPPPSSQPRESWVSTQLFLREFMFEQNVTFLSYRTQCSIMYAKKSKKTYNLKPQDTLTFFCRCHSCTKGIQLWSDNR